MIIAPAAAKSRAPKTERRSDEVLKGKTPMWDSRAGGAGSLRWCLPASGTPAWADRYGPVWRTGTRYNAAEASPSVAGSTSLAGGDWRPVPPPIYII